MILTDGFKKLEKKKRKFKSSDYVNILVRGCVKD